MLRPMESDGEHFLAYYLPKEDVEAEDFISKRKSGLFAEVSPSSVCMTLVFEPFVGGDRVLIHSRL